MAAIDEVAQIMSFGQLRAESGEYRLDPKPPGPQGNVTFDVSIPFATRWHQPPLVHAAISQIIIRPGQGLDVHVFVSKVTVDHFVLSIHTEGNQEYAASWFAIGS